MLNGKYARKIELTIELSLSFSVTIHYLRAFVSADRLIFKYQRQVFLTPMFNDHSMKLFDTIFRSGDVLQRIG